MVAPEGKEGRPPQQWSFKEILANLPARIALMVWKVIGRYGIVLALTLFLFHQGWIPEGARGYVWLLIVVIFVFEKKAPDIIREIKR